MKKWISLVLITALIFLAAGCQSEKKKVVIASKPMAESYIIAEMMGQLIEANSDITVEYKMGIGGGTANIQPAMESGEIDMYPEYTGTGWLFVLKNELVTDSQALYEGVKSQYQEKYNFIWLDRYGFNDTYALAMDKTKADSMGINTFSDLGVPERQRGVGIGI
jgi:Periplasmic glycine betaine/choline-binding (lipo)protein of an ABC-type transport system (osmoprotectant binding protein)